MYKYCIYNSLRMAKKMDDTFHFILLFDLVGTTLLLGLMSYVVITVIT